MEETKLDNFLIIVCVIFGFIVGFLFLFVALIKNLEGYNLLITVFTGWCIILSSFIILFTNTIYNLKDRIAILEKKH
jgi:hypothetical protein